MQIDSVERLENEDTLKMTIEGGTVYNVPDDPENRHRQAIAQWEMEGGTITEPTAGQRGARLRALRHEQTIRHAQRLERQHEAPHEREARLNRASLYAAAIATGNVLTSAEQAQATIDRVTAVYISDINDAMQAGLTALEELTTTPEIRAFDPRADIAWPTLA